MSLTIITGDAGSGKSTQITSYIRADIASERRSILIVPEQQTVTMERQMADALPPSAALTFEVTNFTRLTDTIFRMCGGLAGRSCSQIAEHIIMWRTLSELQPLLRTFRSSPDALTVTHMCTVLRELRAARMTPALLNATAAGLPDGSLKDKISDYALIASTYHALITEHYSDAAESIDRATTLLEQTKCLSGYSIYLDLFSSFSAQQYSFLRALLPFCSLYITLCVPTDEKKQISSVEVLDTLTRLKMLAAETGTTCSCIHLDKSYRLTDPALSYAAKNLYRMDYATLPAYTGEPSSALTLVESPDPTEACAYIAADIRRRLQTEGLRFSDFTVVCSSSSSYEGLLDTAFERNDIPFFFSRASTTLSLEPIKMIFCAYAIITGGWQHSDVVAYLKCAMCGVTKRVSDEIELYAETWDINGSRWYDGVEFNMNPDGFDASHNRGRRAYTNEKLARVNEARRHFVPPLKALAQTASSPHDITTHIRALSEFLLSLNIPEQIEERAEHLARQGSALAQSYAQIWDLLCDTFDTLTQLVPDTRMRAEEFADLLKLLIGNTKIGIFPATVDEVTVGDANLFRSATFKHVYLLGVNEGEFPSTPQDNEAFNEQERLQLLASGISAGTALDLRASRELYAFYRALTLTTKSVSVIWTLTNAAMEKSAPSDTILRLRSLLGNAYPVVRLSPQNLADRIYTMSEGITRLGQCEATPTGATLKKLLAETTNGAMTISSLEEPLCNRDRTLTPTSASTLYAGNIALTQSRLESFIGCPLSYFCTYTLALDSGKKAEFSAANIGNFLHAILEVFFNEAKRSGLDVHNLDLATQKDLLEKAQQSVIEEKLPCSEREKPRTQYLLRTLSQTASAVLSEMCEELKHSQFEPAFFELKIQPDNSSSPAPISFTNEDGSHIYVYGTIDRVDRLQVGSDVYIRVIDYKTGDKSFNPDAIKEGEGLQMPLYLFSILGSTSPAFREALNVPNDGKILPAGVLYLSSLCSTAVCKTPPSAEEADVLLKKIPVRKGLVTDSPEVIALMDDTPNKIYLPVSFNKDGSLSKNSIKFCYSEKRFGELLSELEEVLTQIAKQMKSGTVAATPMHSKKKSACAYCSYEAICRNTAKKASDDDDLDESSNPAEP